MGVGWSIRGSRKDYSRLSQDHHVDKVVDGGAFIYKQALVLVELILKYHNEYTFTCLCVCGGSYTSGQLIRSLSCLACI